MNETNKVGVTLSITFGVLYVSCVIIALALPELYLFLAKNFIHYNANMSNAAMTLGFSGILVGLLESLVLGWVIGCLFVYVYNMISGKEGRLRK